MFIFVALSHLNVGCKPALPTASPDYRDPKEIEAYIQLAETNYPQIRLVPTFVEVGTNSESAWRAVFDFGDSVPEDLPSTGVRRYKLLDTTVINGVPQPLSADSGQAESLSGGQERIREPYLIELTLIDQEHRAHVDMQPSAWIELLCETPLQSDSLKKMSPEKRKRHLSLITRKGLRLEDCESVYISTTGKNTAVTLVGKEEANGVVWSNKNDDAYTFRGKNFGGTGGSDGKELVAWLANLELPEEKK